MTGPRWQPWLSPGANRRCMFARYNSQSWACGLIPR